MNTSVRTASAARWAREGGQAAVELVAMLPLVVAAVVAAGSFLAAGAAVEAAGAAAEAGAVAILQDGDPAAAAEQALGPAAADRATIVVRDREVTVTVRPAAVPAPLAHLLTATERADAGPGPAVRPSRTVIRGGDGESARPRHEDGARP